jgi:hypothetical protein
MINMNVTGDNTTIMESSAFEEKHLNMDKSGLDGDNAAGFGFGLA